MGGRSEYVGTLSKRIAKFLWQTEKIKLSPSDLTQLGNMGAAHSEKQRTYYYDIVNHVNWERSDFGQPHECCFWGCHHSAKDMILENGGGAIRFFNYDYPRSNNDGFARAWLAPFENCWIIFNGYGLTTLAIARILATHLKHSYYKRIKLLNHNSGDGELWINSGGQEKKPSGYLIGPQWAVLEYSSIDLRWKLALPQCIFCEERIEEPHRIPTGDTCCEECWYERFFYCTHCNNTTSREDCCEESPTGDLYCPTCWDINFFLCKKCNKIKNRQNDLYPSRLGKLLCRDCVNAAPNEIELTAFEIDYNYRMII